MSRLANRSGARQPHRPGRWLLILALTLLAGPALATADAGSVEQNGARFDTRIQLDDRTLALTGTGVARYRVIFTVYAAALYAPANIQADDILATDTPRRLEIEYFHTISAEDIIRAATTKLEDQRTPEQLAALQPAIERFHNLFEEVSEGDRYRMDYQPGAGITLSFNGEKVGRVEGADFAAAYFAIWLDANDPLSRSLRDDLLTGLR